MPKLSASELRLLRECCYYAIADQSWDKSYYRLGGSGYVPIRYSYGRMQKLEKLGFVYSGSVRRATRAGRELIAQQLIVEGRPEEAYQLTKEST